MVNFLDFCSFGWTVYPLIGPVFIGPLSSWLDHLDLGNKQLKIRSVYVNTVGLIISSMIFTLPKKLVDGSTIAFNHQTRLHVLIGGIYPNM